MQDNLYDKTPDVVENACSQQARAGSAGQAQSHYGDRVREPAARVRATRAP